MPVPDPDGNGAVQCVTGSVFQLSDLPKATGDLDEVEREDWSRFPMWLPWTLYKRATIIQDWMTEADDRSC
jgi:hypothetical protein